MANAQLLRVVILVPATPLDSQKRSVGGLWRARNGGEMAAHASAQAVRLGETGMEWGGDSTGELGVGFLFYIWVVVALPEAMGALSS